jgi:hypothetical protein
VSPRSSPPASAAERNRVHVAIARLRAGVLAIVFGLVGGSGLAFATAWLVLLGGDEVGPHLGLLANFFPGYSVSGPGVAVGFLYGLVSGGLLGGFIGAAYNRLADWRARRR